MPADDADATWYPFVTAGRFSEAADQRAYVQDTNRRTAQVLIDAARVSGVQDVLDVGSGDGLVGVSAAKRLARGSSVTFSDISPRLVRAMQNELVPPDGIAYKFAASALESLAERPSAAYDVVLGRSVLAFCSDLRRVFGNLRCLLRAKARVVFHEWLDALLPLREGEFMGFEVPPPIEPLVQRIRQSAAVLSAGQNERLFSHTPEQVMCAAEDVGFAVVNVDVHCVAHPGTHFRSLAGFRTLQGNPFVPNCETIIADALTSDEQDVFYGWLSESLDERRGRYRRAGALILLTD